MQLVACRKMDTKIIACADYDRADLPCGGAMRGTNAGSPFNTFSYIRNGDTSVSGIMHKRMWWFTAAEADCRHHYIYQFII